MADQMMPQATNSSQSDADQEGSESTVVCIAEVDDGSYSVYMDGDEGNAQTVGSVDEALDAARQMFEGEDKDEEEDKGNAQLAPGDAKSAWDQLAAKSDKRRMVG